MCRHKQIVKKVKELVAQNPAECIILQGYSQGASATCDALPELTGPAFDAVKGVVLLGNPEHRPDLTCNVDLYGGKSTRKAVGFFGTKGGIPSEWASKSLDVCNFVSLRPRRVRLIYIAFNFTVEKLGLTWTLHRAMAYATLRTVSASLCSISGIFSVHKPKAWVPNLCSRSLLLAVEKQINKPPEFLFDCEALTICQARRR